MSDPTKRRELRYEIPFVIPDVSATIAVKDALRLDGVRRFVLGVAGNMGLQASPAVDLDRNVELYCPTHDVSCTVLSVYHMTEKGRSGRLSDFSVVLRAPIFGRFDFFEPARGFGKFMAQFDKTLYYSNGRKVADAIVNRGDPADYRLL